MLGIAGVFISGRVYRLLDPGQWTSGGTSSHVQGFKSSRLWHWKKMAKKLLELVSKSFYNYFTVYGKITKYILEQKTFL
jgi:hypothetical protein